MSLKLQGQGDEAPSQKGSIERRLLAQAAIS